jgi:hypothetical protein
MQQAKELFINSVRQVRIQGHSVVPTVVLYKDKKSFVGFDALESGDQASELREDFKIQIGNDDPVKLAQSRSGTASGQGRSILGIAKDFMDAVLAQALMTIHLQGYEAPSRILVAEPLSLSQLGRTDSRTTIGSRIIEAAFGAFSPASLPRSISCRSHLQCFNTTATA